MLKTTFKIAKMDCPSEEQIIRLKLAELPNILALDFDIANRTLTVYHTQGHEVIHQLLDELNFDTSVVHTIEEKEISFIDNSIEERKLLWKVLVINAFFFLLEMSTGFLSHSLGLVADSLDMLADSVVYALALFAVGSTAAHKKNVAKYAGYLQLILAMIGVIEVIRRFIGVEETPEFMVMIVISILALIGNTLCLSLLQKSKSNEAHLQASMIFTSNDVIVNLGVIIAGSLVYLTNSKYPDLIIGTIVFAIVGRGAYKILKLSK